MTKGRSATQRADKATQEELVVYTHAYQSNKHGTICTVRHVKRLLVEGQWICNKKGKGRGRVIKHFRAIEKYSLEELEVLSALVTAVPYASMPIRVFTQSILTSKLWGTIRNKAHQFGGIDEATTSSIANALSRLKHASFVRMMTADVRMQSVLEGVKTDDIGNPDIYLLEDHLLGIMNSYRENPRALVGSRVQPIVRNCLCGKALGFTGMFATEDYIVVSGQVSRLWPYRCDEHVWHITSKGPEGMKRFLHPVNSGGRKRQ